MNKNVIFMMIINLIFAIVCVAKGEVTTAVASIQCILWLDIIRRDNDLIDDLMRILEEKKGK